VSNLSVGQSVAVSATNALLVTKTHTDTTPVTASDGTSALNLRSLGGGPVIFYAYTTRSAIGTVTVVTGSDTYTRYLIGKPGPAYNITVETPSHTIPKSSNPLSVGVSDVFGNSINQSDNFNPETNLKVVALGARVSPFTYSSELKSFTSSLTPIVSAGTLVLSVGITANDVPGLSEPRSLEVLSVIVADFEAMFQSLRLELDWLKVQEKIARQAHNKLARKWNRQSGKKIKLLNKETIVTL
jgi:hypothetical protein